MVRIEYEKTPIQEQMVAEYDYPDTASARERTEDFKAAIAHEKHKHLQLVPVINLHQLLKKPGTYFEPFHISCLFLLFFHSLKCKMVKSA